MSDPAAIEKLLVRLAPNGAGVAVRSVDAALLDQLTDDERAVVRFGGPVRRAEFAAGRWCAHRALARIGADTCSIGRGRRGQPVWPRGVTGSISHAAGVAAAVAAPATPAVAGLGIDVELADSVNHDLWPEVLTPSERARCESDNDPGAVAAQVFGAKEAAFKALYPLLGMEIDFLEANADVDAGTVAVPRFNAFASVRSGGVDRLVVTVAIVTASV